MNNEITIREESSEGKGVPEGAEILKTDTTLKVKKISNGFILCKNTEYKYQLGDRTDWANVTVEKYVKKNPMGAKGLSDLVKDFK